MNYSAWLRACFQLANDNLNLNLNNAAKFTRIFHKRPKTPCENKINKLKNGKTKKEKKKKKKKLNSIKILTDYRWVNKLAKDVRLKKHSKIKLNSINKKTKTILAEQINSASQPNVHKQFVSRRKFTMAE